MNQERILILDEQQIGRTLKRMAFQIWEHNSKADTVTFIGVEKAGAAVARNLSRIFEEISGIPAPVLPLKVNKKRPLEDNLQIEEALTGKSIVLVDDVANSGKTLLYALKPVLEYEPRQVLIAVLVDRKHKAFPISPDIVGHTVSTTIQDHIEVRHEDDRLTAAYLH